VTHNLYEHYAIDALIYRVGTQNNRAAVQR
jgi:hypothetical protein